MKVSISALVVLGPLLLLLVQIVLYRRTRRFISFSFPKQETQRFLLPVLGVLFIGANIPLVVMIVTALVSDGSPFSASETLGPLARYFLYLMVVWHLGSIVSFCVILGVNGLRWLLKVLSITEGTAPPTKVVPVEMSRRQFLRNAGVGLAALPFAASTYGVFVASQEFKIE